MDYEEGAARIVLLEPIFSPPQSLIPRFPEEVMQINLTGILNFFRESVSPEEAKNKDAIEMIFTQLRDSWEQQKGLTSPVKLVF